jgi:hypothetical protein
VPEPSEDPPPHPPIRKATPILRTQLQARLALVTMDPPSVAEEHSKPLGRGDPETFSLETTTRYANLSPRVPRDAVRTDYREILWRRRESKTSVNPDT